MDSKSVKAPVYNKVVLADALDIVAAKLGDLIVAAMVAQSIWDMNHIVPRDANSVYASAQMKVVVAEVL